jgi:TIR domain
MSGNPTGKASLFYSYARKDARLRENLEKSLAQLKREGKITDWYDREILAGSVWDDVIKQQIERARIILLLISPDFMASEYIWRTEVALAMGRRSRNEVIVIPVIVRPADWHSAPFGSLQALPRDGKPVVKWANQDEAWLDVAKGLRSVLANL